MNWITWPLLSSYVNVPLRCCYRTQTFTIPVICTCFQNNICWSLSKKLKRPYKADWRCIDFSKKITIKTWFTDFRKDSTNNFSSPFPPPPIPPPWSKKEWEGDGGRREGRMWEFACLNTLRRNLPGNFRGQKPCTRII